MNPIKQVREDNHLTQRAFASLAGVSEQVVIRAEAGLFGTLPPSIIKAVQTFTHDSDRAITVAYERWIEKELTEVKLPNRESDSMILYRSGFTEWKDTVCALNNVPHTTWGFCGLFKMHPYVIEKWESGKMKSPPLQLVQRLAHMRGIM